MRIATEAATKDDKVMVAEEITIQAEIDYEKVVRGVLSEISFDAYVEHLSNVGGQGFSNKTCEVLVRLNMLSPAIVDYVQARRTNRIPLPFL